MNDMNVLLPHIKLRLNIDHPTFEECYAYGYECAVAEVAEEENPFAEGSEEHEQWAEGWWAGFYGEEPLFPLKEAGVEESPVTENLVAANEQEYHPFLDKVLEKCLNLTGALVATAIVGYQVFDLVA
ncbi:transmission trait enhancer LetE [Legionella sp. CNM-4043-24]|uniref:transmission trait enhancer LetE n=1 Tax=Legionella sp. CNM-4043-24 TaxID=3421646 RepID=UPI00403ADD07